MNYTLSQKFKLNQEGIPCLCGKGKIQISPLCFKCTCEKQTTVFREYFKKKLTIEEAMKLINGDTVYLTGLVSKAGKAFSGKATLMAGGKLNIVF